MSLSISKTVLRRLATMTLPVKSPSTPNSSGPVETFADCVILPWDADAAELFLNCRRQRVRIGSMELKIACIALAHAATLLTRNATDLAHVPGLRSENWLDRVVQQVEDANSVLASWLIVSNHAATRLIVRAWPSRSTPG